MSNGQNCPRDWRAILLGGPVRGRFVPIRRDPNSTSPEPTTDFGFRELLFMNLRVG